MNTPTTALEITVDTSAFYRLDHADAPLYVANLDEPYRAKLLLTKDGVLRLDTRHPSHNATPVDEWHGVTQAWGLPAAVRGTVLHRLLTSPDTLALFQRAWEGHEVEWNGNNWVGVLDDDARDANDDLETLFADLAMDYESHWSIWPAGDWVAKVDLSDLWPADQSLEAAASRVIEDAREEGVLCGHEGEVQSALIDNLAAEIEENEDFAPSLEQLKALGIY